MLLQTKPVHSKFRARSPTQSQDSPFSFNLIQCLLSILSLKWSKAAFFHAFLSISRQRTTALLMKLHKLKHFVSLVFASLQVNFKQKLTVFRVF